MFVAMAGTVVLGAIAMVVMLIAGAAIPPANGGDDMTALASGDFQNSFTLSRHYCNRISDTLILRVCKTYGKLKRGRNRRIGRSVGVC
jgi:hypothetical protein